MQPICDVAYNPEEIKARLSGVPVYTVANKQNEFILVAGEVGLHTPRPYLPLCTLQSLPYIMQHAVRRLLHVTHVVMCRAGTR